MTTQDNSGGDGRKFEVGLGYPHFQLAKALRNASAKGDEKASAKAEKWHQVIEGIFSGALVIGSRTPIAGTPPWVTLEVVTGGFVTGNMLAGGELTDQEIALASELGVPVGSETRAILNAYYLSDNGQSRLANIMENGRFSIEVPEEGALLVVAWLLRHGDVTAAQSLLDEVIPFFDRLRFFPQPTVSAIGNSAHVCIQTAGETADALRRVTSSPQFDAQVEAIQIWTPLYDRAVALLLETVEGESPRVEQDASGKPVRNSHGRYLVSGAMPCVGRPSGWNDRANALLEEYREKLAVHHLCKAWHRKDKPFQRFLAAIDRYANTGDVAKMDQAYLRVALARVIAKRGLPNSETHMERRKIQRRQCAGPRYHEIAKILATRIEAFPENEGLQDISLAQAPIAAEEETDLVQEGTSVPAHLIYKIGRAQVETLRALTDSGYITSADMLAKVLPQMTSEILASSIISADLRRIYAQIYRAFRRRRSLLLLNLQSQVRLEDLPWIRALEPHRQNSVSNRELAKAVLIDVVTMALGQFPHAIVPNKLLQELRKLATQAGLNIPLVDEIAADIFMGMFSAKFPNAALIAGEMMAGTLYERYYGIDYSQIEKLLSRTKDRSGTFPTLTSIWKRLIRREQDDNRDATQFSIFCIGLTKSRFSEPWNIAANGMIIEQAQIVTTHNLAVLFRFLDLKTVYGSHISDLAKSCFEWICRRQQIRFTEHHARLIMLKNTAYAWRQMIFFMSFMSPDEQRLLVAWMGTRLSEQSAEFQTRFEPAFTGLRAAVDGRKITATFGRRFLGWTVGPHWMMPK